MSSKQYLKEYHLAHREERNAKSRIRENAKNAQIRELVLKHYGKSCVCCSEKNTAFLCIDHINGGGEKHRKQIGGGSAFYKWIVKNDYPDGFQTLCHNCNFAKWRYGICPHKL